jgi:hypothetical protein
LSFAAGSHFVHLPDGGVVLDHALTLLFHRSRDFINRGPDPWSQSCLKTLQFCPDIPIAETNMHESNDQAIIAAARSADDGKLRICAWCQRIPLREDHWVEVHRSELIVREMVDQATHGICPDCFNAFISGRRKKEHLLPELKSAESRRPLPESACYVHAIG